MARYVPPGNRGPVQQNQGLASQAPISQNGLQAWGNRYAAGGNTPAGGYGASRYYIDDSQIRDELMRQMAYYAPDFAAIGEARSAGQRSAGNNAAQNALDMEKLKSGYNFGTMNNALDGRGTDIQLENIPAYLAWIQEQKKNALNMGGVELARLDQTDKLANDLYGLDLQGFQKARGDAVAALAQQVIGINSNAAQFGNFSKRSEQDRAEGQRQLDSTNTGINLDTTRAQLQKDDALAASKNRREAISWDLKNAMGGFDNEARKISEREQLLKLEAQKQKVSQAELEANYAMALRQANLDHMISVGQLIEMKNSNDAKERELNLAIMRNVAASGAQATRVPYKPVAANPFKKGFMK